MWSWNKDTEWGIALGVSLRFAVLVCYDDLLCWSVMIIGFFSCLWLFALLVFHDNSFLFVSYDYWLCLCFMIICFFFWFPMIICFVGVSWWFAFPPAILTPTTADLPIPQTHYYGMNRGLFDIGNIDSQAHGFRKWKYSWGLSHTTCMLLIEVSYFYSVWNLKPSPPFHTFDTQSPRKFPKLLRWIRIFPDSRLTKQSQQIGWFQTWGGNWNLK